MTDPSSSSPHPLSLLRVIPFLSPLRVQRVISQPGIVRSEFEQLFSGLWRIYFSIEIARMIEDRKKGEMTICCTYILHAKGLLP